MPIITPLAGPPSVQSGSSPSSAQMDARARAIARLTEAPSAQPAPVPNPSQIAPEEMSAVTSQVQEQGETTGQSTTTDAPPVSEEATAPKEAPLSSQYAQLAKREKQIHAKANAVKAQEAALKAREEAIKAQEAEMQNKYVPKDALVKDTYNTLLQQGFTPEQITQMLLNAPDPAQYAQDSVIKELRAEIQALKDGQESTKKTYQDNQTQQYQQAVNTIRMEAKQLVKSDPAFETIQATSSVDDVVELITKTFENDGVLLTVEEAANAVEDYLVEEALKVARLKKIQDRLRPAAQAAPQQQTQAKQPPKTLTSAMGTSAKLSAKERAILAFKGELK